MTATPTDEPAEPAEPVEPTETAEPTPTASLTPSETPEATESQAPTESPVPTEAAGESIPIPTTADSELTEANRGSVTVPEAAYPGSGRTENSSPNLVPGFFRWCSPAVAS